MMSRCHGHLVRKFCTRTKIDWTNGSEKIAQALFEVYTVEVEDGPRVDPRGMRSFELKKKLEGLKHFNGDLNRANEFHAEIVSRWQRLYSEFINGTVKLPGRDPAGPLTFHHEADKENVRIVYDKHGRVDH
jgi:Fe-S-cluster formation regulator IscX/YfhJ